MDFVFSKIGAEKNSLKPSKGLNLKIKYSIIFLITIRSLPKRENSISFVVIEILSYRQKKLIVYDLLRLERENSKGSPTGSLGTAMRPSLGMPDGIGSPPETTAGTNT